MTITIKLTREEIAKMVELEFNKRFPNSVVKLNEKSYYSSDYGTIEIEQELFQESAPEVIQDSNISEDDIPF